MDELRLQPSAYAVRRPRRRMPSLARNFLLALLCLAGFSGLVWAAVNFLGNPKDAIASGQVQIDPIPLPASADTLDGESSALPDLLEGEVPADVNPTVLLDALGNPVTDGPEPDNSNAQAAGSDLVGGNSPDNPPTLIPQNPGGPKTILIDGQPLDGTGDPSGFAASPLPQAPISGLTRMSPFGPVPAPGANGRQAVDAYARPFAGTEQDTVSLIIGGLGIDRNLTRRIINETPPEVTLSFAAHTNGLQTWINQARARGHEVLIELPMESAEFNPAEPGADRALTTINSAAQNIRQLDFLMSRAQGYFAVTNYNGDVILQRSDLMSPIMQHLSDAGLGFIHDGSTGSASLPVIAEEASLPFVTANRLIDASPTPSAIQAELSNLKAIAQAGGAPIGVGFAYPETLTEVKSWVSKLEASGLTLAPASHALKK